MKYAKILAVVIFCIICFVFGVFFGSNKLQAIELENSREAQMESDDFALLGEPACERTDSPYPTETPCEIEYVYVSEPSEYDAFFFESLELLISDGEAAWRNVIESATLSETGVMAYDDAIRYYNAISTQAFDDGYNQGNSDGYGDGYEQGVIDAREW